MDKISVVIVDDVAQTRQDISRLLYFEEDLAVIGEAGTGEEALQAVEQERPDVVLMDINMPGMDGIRATEEITARFPETAIIIISIQGEQEYLKKAMMAGAREYLTKPFSGDELAGAIRQVNQLVKRRLGGGKSAGGLPPRRGKTVAVFSGKGGVGKTFVAANLAVTLGAGAKVGVLDLDLQFGDVAAMLGLKAKRTLDQLAVEEIIDWETVQTYILPHISGIHILPGADSIEGSELVTQAVLQQVIELMVEQFDYLIIDLASGFDDVNVMALDKADTILGVITPDLLSLKSAGTVRAVLERLGHSEKLQLVENCDGREACLKKQVLEQSLESSVITSIPYAEKVAMQAINKGVPPALMRNDQSLNLAFERMAKAVTGQETTVASKGLLQKIFSF